MEKAGRSDPLSLYTGRTMRTLALDVGDATIGVAVTDPLGITAQGVTTIERVGIKKDTTAVCQYIEEFQCNTVVCGLPIKLDGTDSPQTEKVREFARRLENKLKSTGHPEVSIVFQDERLTTMQAERILLDADVSRKKRKTVIDKQAAILILQGYMDSHR